MASRSIDVRESFLWFPPWTQHFWTWATGKALPRQQPLIRHTWFSYTALTLTFFFAGLTLSVLSVSLHFRGWGVALACGWILSLCAARTMILVIAHQCIHNQFSGNPKWDKSIAELITVLNIYEDALTFRREHFNAHHRHGVFATSDDPPVQLLLRLGFRPGMSRRQLWIRAVLVFFSPAFYWNGFVNRMKSNFTAGGWRRVGFLAWAGAWFSTPFWMRHGTQVLLLAFVIPIVLISQLSALLDKLGEHAWLTPADPKYGQKYHQFSATWARYCGRAVPGRSLPPGKRFVAWVSWVLAMTLYHLPSRLLVIVGDLPNHDFHHRYPGTKEWATAAYARQREIDTLSNGSPPYIEVWGMAQAIDRMFQGLMEAPAYLQDPPPARALPHKAPVASSQISS